MKHYELLLVFKPTLTEEETGQKVALMKEVLEKNGAVIATMVEMGARKLAYEVKKYERGTYFVFYFQAPSTSIFEIERLIRFNEDIIKFLTVKFENKKEIEHWKKLSNTSEVEKKAEPKESPKEEAKEETKEEPESAPKE